MTVSVVDASYTHGMSKLTGRGWEHQLAFWHTRYELTGQAWIAQTHPRAKVGPGGRLVWESKGAPDFVGTLSGGRGVCFDAKESTKHSIAFSNIPDHQRRALAAVHALGGLAFLACRVAGNICFIVPWATLGPMLSSGERGSVNIRHGYATPGGDWLPVVIKENL